MSKAKAYFKENLILVIAFIAVSAIEIAVVFPIMCGDYLSYDSSYQYALTQHSIPDIWRLLPYDYSPPFYAMALKLYCNVFGSSLLAMRSFSLFAIVGIYFISTFPVNAIFGKRSALICLITTFACTNIFGISHEIRPTLYGFFLFEAAAVCAGLVFSKGTRYSYIWLTIFSVLAMYTHNVAMIGTFSVYVALAAIMLLTKQWKKFRNVFISGCICAVLYLPWFWVLLSQSSNVHDHYWTSKNSFRDVMAWTFSDYVYSDISFILPEIIRLIIIAVFIFAIFRHINFKSLKTAKTLGEAVRFKADNPICLKNILFFALCLAISLAIMELVVIFMRNIRAGRYYYILAMIWIVILSAFLGNYGGKVICALFAVLILANHTMNIAQLRQAVDSANIKEMVEKIHSDSDGNISFVHFHEHSLGIMYYYFPEATHYVCDKTFTVLGTYDVFPGKVIDIGSMDNIWEYTDRFYMFKNNWQNLKSDAFIVNKLEKMNDNEVIDIGVYQMPFAAFGGTFELSEAVHTSESQ